MLFAIILEAAVGRPAFAHHGQRAVQLVRKHGQKAALTKNGFIAQVFELPFNRQLAFRFSRSTGDFNDAVQAFTKRESDQQHVCHQQAGVNLQCVLKGTLLGHAGKPLEESPCAGNVHHQSPPHQAVIPAATRPWVSVKVQNSG